MNGTKGNINLRVMQTPLVVHANYELQAEKKISVFTDLKYAACILWFHMNANAKGSFAKTKPSQM